MVGLFFLSYHAPEGPVNGKPQVRSRGKTAPAVRPVSVGAVCCAGLTHCPQRPHTEIRLCRDGPVLSARPHPTGCLQPLVRPIFACSLSLPGKTCYNFKGHNGIDRGNLHDRHRDHRQCPGHCGGRFTGPAGQGRPERALPGGYFEGSGAGHPVHWGLGGRLWGWPPCSLGPRGRWRGC